jgi:hypothetical protein
MYTNCYIKIVSQLFLNNDSQKAVKHNKGLSQRMVGLKASTEENIIREKEQNIF